MTKKVVLAYKCPKEGCGKEFMYYHEAVAHKNQAEGFGHGIVAIEMIVDD